MSIGQSSEQMIPSSWVRTGPDKPSWYAVYTRSRHEKKVAAQLAEMGILTFLPFVTETHQWCDRRKVVELPLFPGYAFVHTDLTPHQRVRVLRTPGIVGFVGVKGIGIAIPDKQIEDLRTLLAQKLPCALHPFLREGQRVRVRGGCLDGIEGILIGVNSNRSIVISVDPILRSVAIRIEGYDVEPI
jgi:transcription antitermination factor NusG